MTSEQIEWSAAEQIVLLFLHAQARKDDAERKRLEALQKKKERDEMMAAEDAQVQATTKKAAGPQPKLTRAQIRAEAERRAAAAMAAVQNKQKAAAETHLDKPIEENLNRTDPEVISATGVDQALAALR